MSKPTITVHDALVRVLLHEDAPHGWVCQIKGDPSSVCWFASARNAAAWYLSQDRKRVGTPYEYTLAPAAEGSGAS